MAIVIESHMTTSPAYIMVRSDKYPSIYGTVLIDHLELNDADKRYKVKVDSLFARLWKAEDAANRLSDLFPEAEANPEAPDLPVEAPPQSARRVGTPKRGKKGKVW